MQPTSVEMPGKNEFWKVELGAAAPYPHVWLRRRLETHPEYAVLVVEVHKLLRLHDNEQMAIPYAEHWPKEKYRGLQMFLDPADEGAAEMPIVGVSDRPLQQPGWWNKLRKKTTAVTAVSFTNGRHRARIMMHMGASHIPVETHISNLQRLKSLCC